MVSFLLPFISLHTGLLPDEADNHLVELAVAGGARFIVTRNLRDVARMELRFPELRIVSPEDFLKEIAS